MKKVKLIPIFTIVTALIVGCSSQDVSNQHKEVSKKEVANKLSKQSQTLAKNDLIAGKEYTNETISTSQEKSDNNTKNEFNNPPLTSSGKKEYKTQTVSKEETDSADDKNSNLEKDYIIIEDTKYFNIMQSENFKHQISVSEKYGAKLYGVPYSDVATIVKDGEQLVRLSTGVTAAKLNNLDILCDLMLDNGEYADQIIAAIKQVAQTGESVQLDGFQEYGGYFIFKRDNWIGVSW